MISLILAGCCSGDDIEILGTSSFQAFDAIGVEADSIQVNQAASSGFTFILEMETQMVFRMEVGMQSMYAWQCEDLYTNEISFDDIFISSNKDIEIGTEMIAAGSNIVGTDYFNLRQELQKDWIRFDFFPTLETIANFEEGWHEISFSAVCSDGLELEESLSVYFY